MIFVSRCAAAAACLLAASTPMLAYPANKGAITGAGDPGAQVIVTELDGGKVIGVMVGCDGHYRAEDLKPGRYQIIEGGPHHAARTVSVKAGEDAHVDLAPQDALKPNCK